MSRRHTFVIVVLLGAAAVAGLLAMTRTAALGSSASASTGQDDAISFRLRKLDRLEASLRKQLEARGAVATSPASLPGSSVVRVRSGTQSYDDSYEHEGAEEHEDDAGYDDEDRDD